MVIVGSEKTAIVDCVIQKIRLVNNSSEVYEDVNLTPNNTIRDEIKYLINQTNENKIINEPAPNGVVGKRIISIIETARDSLEKNFKSKTP